MGALHLLEMRATGMYMYLAHTLTSYPVHAMLPAALHIVDNALVTCTRLPTYYITDSRTSYLTDERSARTSHTYV